IDPRNTSTQGPITNLPTEGDEPRDASIEQKSLCRTTRRGAGGSLRVRLWRASGHGHHSGLRQFVGDPDAAESVANRHPDLAKPITNRHSGTTESIGNRH